MFCRIGINTRARNILYFREQKNKATTILALVSITESKQRQKTIWILWVISFSIIIITKAVALFCSTGWFGHPIKITGPYSVINITLQIYVPLLTIFIPITVGSFTNILSKYEKRYGSMTVKKKNRIIVLITIAVILFCTIYFLSFPRWKENRLFMSLINKMP